MTKAQQQLDSLVFQLLLGSILAILIISVASIALWIAPADPLPIGLLLGFIALGFYISLYSWLVLRGKLWTIFQKKTDTA